MTPNVEPLRPSKQDGSTRVFCVTCGHSEFVHEGNRGCLYSVCDCNRFLVGAEARLDPSARSVPLPGIRACSPKGWGHRYEIGSPTLRPSFLGPSTR